MKDLEYLIDLIENAPKNYIDWILKGEEKDLELFIFWLQLFNITPEQKQEVINKLYEVINKNIK